MIRKPLVSAITAALILTGCGSLTPQPEIITPPVLTCDGVQVPALALERVEWSVVAGTEQGVVYALTASEYVKLSKNMITTLEWVKGKTGQVLYYRKCIDSYNTALKDLEPS